MANLEPQRVTLNKAIPSGPYVEKQHGEAFVYEQKEVGGEPDEVDVDAVEMEDSSR